ncbi:TPA: ABC transporter ATP-binding protein [Streptococcus equi subsp. zooepidemicus]|uniref:ABC transporter ATP-binding protein n=1 Tax=Streptococcus agalactiae TaxID=1311 RepID=UPI001374E7F3|nr:ABC transporter ATP-binding protein [Streptococcus agalactiae]HEL0178058.1 ABC transporter ATP-binding protein [Streptococcus equi subsp. zooepidemicus]KAF1174495.1 sodium ABC transporter ATP-binding protein [Streptococcus agalactiae]KAF1180464.1 sodium ABC transporter ATP-binding protein [Streptococcus agalactiae]HEL0180233.1 ABC transporter ATP-binding protein [Streptococcus equi subsp. zooepidemicus]HEL0204206.1 ABC transporter ATP-binding protein [Streptococcus equi subsp. zooepidemicus
MENVIEITGLSKKYKNFELSNVSIVIPNGCVAGFIGLNGHGKTTTIRTMLGLSKKNSGKVKLLGRDIDKYEKEVKNSIGVVFDDGYLYDSLKMKDMKNIVAKSYTQWDEDAYRNFMNRFSLNENQVISTLSKGMKMKFALTLALSHHAELLIMDEPTSGLDPLIRKELLSILNEFMQNGGKGVFYSSHITSDLDKFADVIVFINEGKIVFVEDKDFLLDSFVSVKGDSKLLTENNKKYFTYLKTNEYGFTGVTNQLSKLKESIPEIISERINLETLMLAYIEGGKNNA